MEDNEIIKNAIKFFETGICPKCEFPNIPSERESFGTVNNNFEVLICENCNYEATLIASVY